MALLILSLASLYLCPKLLSTWTLRLCYMFLLARVLGYSAVPGEQDGHLEQARQGSRIEDHFQNASALAAHFCTNVKMQWKMRSRDMISRPPKALPPSIEDTNFIVVSHLLLMLLVIMLTAVHAVEGTATTSYLLAELLWAAL
eukprot:3083012-Amphidinium_carterae.1